MKKACLVLSLDYEIALMRVLSHLFEHLPDDTKSGEYLKYLDQIGLMCSRIARLFLVRHKLKEAPGPDFSSLLRLDLE